MPGGNLKSQTLLQLDGYLPVKELKAIENAQRQSSRPTKQLDVSGKTGDGNCHDGSDCGLA